MRYLLFLLALAGAFSSFSQTRTYYGRIIDSKKVGIPFAIVQAKGKNTGVYCDDAGRFSFAASDSFNTLVFLCLGYERKEMPIIQLTGDSIIIELKENSIVMHEYSVKALGNVLGRRDLKHTGDSYGRYGNEQAVYLKANKIPKNATVGTVFIYITDEGVPDTKFRIHIYNVDPETSLPGTELTDTNVIINATKGNEWVTADLSNKNIPIKSGLFVSVEWVAVGGNKETSMSSRKHATVTEYYGQVLGLTNTYGSSNSKIYRRRALENGEWGFFDCRKVSNFRKCDVPMIYCTYNTPK